MSSVVDVILRLTDNVTSKLQSINNAMAKTANTSKRLSSTVKTVGKNIGSIGTAMAPVASGIVAAGAAGAKAFIGFDATITAAGAKAGATKEELAKMRETAASLGAKFPVSSSAVATAMDSLAASGFNANETIGVMPSILTAAVASGNDLATTSTVVTSALNVWNLKQGDVGKNATRMADVIQQAANKSSLTMTDFGVALQYAGAPAAALNVQVEELSTALALIKNKGIDASTAGTSLRSMFTRLAKPPKEAANAIAQLGLKVKDEKGNFIGLENVIGQMRKAMDGMNNTERIALAQAIAGTEGYSSLLALIDTAPEKYAKMTADMNAATGSSAAQYEIMQNTVKGSIESLAINTGDVMAPKMKQAADAIAAVADALNKLTPEQKANVANCMIGIVAATLTAITIGKLVTIVGAAINIYSAFTTVLAGNAIKNKALEYTIKGVIGGVKLLRNALITAIPKMGAIFSAMMTPMGLAVIAVIALGYLIYRNWDTIKKVLLNTFNAVVAAFRTAFGAIKAFAGGYIGALLNNFMTMRNLLVGVLVSIITFITSVFKGDWQAAWDSVLGIFQSIANGITGIFSNTMNGIRSMVNAITGGINSIKVNIPSWVPGFGGKQFGPLGIPMLAAGTESWSGGTAMIHDKGAEIVDLPTGSRVIPHDKSITTAYQQGKAQSGSNFNGNVNVYISDVTVNGENDIEKLARRVANQIYAQLQKRAVNLKVGAI